MIAESDLWQRADRLFDEAVDHAPSDRRAVLDRACQGEPELRRLVEALLEAEDRDGGLLDQRPQYEMTTAPEGATPGPRNSGEIDLVGRRIGPFAIVGELGRGGMAVVYRARRVDGEVDQEVAIKVLARSLGSRDARERFRRERQILATSDHPGMARLFDGGETSEGLLYLVMELVEGERVDEFCDRRRLNVRERVELFQQIARTVADAHRRLVVHRDIKPSNIMVSRGGFPKLLDFGIAKLLEDPSDATRTGWLLTPAYAAPEQFSGGEITTATDVYQLGLLLYSLLVGASPYPVDGAPADIVEQVCRTPPERPGLAIGRLATRDEDGSTGPLLAARRVGSPRQLRALLSGDLEAILLMALRKEPERRYGSVEAMLSDLERCLEGRPVQARKGTLAYRCRKLLERHRTVVAISLLGLLSLVGWATTSSLDARRLAAERDRANREAETAQQVSTFLAGLFTGSDPLRGASADLTATELLERGTARLATEQLDDPLVRARLEATIGTVWHRLSRYERAIELLGRASRTFATELDPTDPAAIRARRLHIAALHLSGDFDGAEVLARQMLADERARGASPAEQAALLDRLGEIALTQGRLADAEARHRQAIDLTLAVSEDAAAHSRDRLARVLATGGRLLEAASLFESVLASYLSRLDPDHPSILVTERRIAELLGRLGRVDEARRGLEATLVKHRRVLGDEHAMTWAVVQSRAELEHRSGHLDQALDDSEEAQRGLADTAGPGHPMTLEARAMGGRILSELGRFAEAESLLADSVEQLRASLGADNPMTLAAELGSIEHQERTGAGSWGRFVDLATRAERALGPSHPTTARAAHAAAASFARAGDRAAAIEWLSKALAADHRPALRPELTSLAEAALPGPLAAWRTRRAAEAAGFARGG